MRRTFPVPTLLWAMLALLAGAAPAAGQTVSGWIHAVWQVSSAPDEPVRVTHLFSDDAGHTQPLRIDRALLEANGGTLGLDRRRVTLDVSQAAADGPAAARPLDVRRITTLDHGPHLAVSGAPAEGAPQSGAKPYVTILCRFADSVNYTPHERPFFDDMLTGNGSLGLDNYWREASEDRVNLSGSAVVGWVNLPSPEAAYFTPKADGTPDYTRPNFNKLSGDCAGLANAEIDFSKFFGINLQFNTRLGGWSWGGGGYFNLDGPGRVMPMTWMASWANHATYGHEIGHSFGLPHSSGPYTATYDSRWDVMSGGGGTDGSQYVGVHTIGWHKHLLGWVPAARQLAPLAGTRTRVALERGAQPAAGTNHLLVSIPTTSTAIPFYTVEARRRNGFDRFLPGEGVLIHAVNPNRGDRAAQVVDADNDGDANDDGAIWIAGETFADSLNGVTVQVDSGSATVSHITVVRGWQLELAVQGGGTISAPGASCDTRCQALFATRGQVAAVTATPAAGWAFTGWSGACTGTAPCSVTLGGNRAVTARFARPVVITGDSVRRAALMGAAFADTLTATGGGTAIAWRMAGGALPEGLTLDAAGLVRGIPGVNGTFRFSATASSEGLEQTRQFVLEVRKPTVTATAVMDGLLQGSTLTADEARFLDLLGNRNGRVDVGDARAWLVDTQQITATDAARLRELIEAMDAPATSAPAAPSTTHPEIRP